MPFIFDPLQILFSLPGLTIGLFAQLLLKSSYGTQSRVSAGTNMTGMQAAEIINKGEGYNVNFITTPGELNDYYNPANNTVNVSSDNATNMSVANIAVVAHEFGHVQQKFSGSTMFAIRSWLVPFVNIGSTLGIILIMVGFGLGIAANIGGVSIIWLGVILFSSTTLFSLVTLPIELDASRRGMELIKKYNLISVDNYSGARAVLNAAALTYFASLVASIGQLLYFVMLAQQSSNRE